MVLGKPIKIQCNYACSRKLTKIFCLRFKILAIISMNSQWKALQSKMKIILTCKQYIRNYLNERRRLLLSICDAIQCGKTGNKIKMKMTHSMSSLSVLLAGQMWMPELGVLFMVGYKLNNLNFHAIPNCVDYSLNETLIYIVSLYDNRWNLWKVEYFRKIVLDNFYCLRALKYIQFNFHKESQLVILLQTRKLFEKIINFMFAYKWRRKLFKQQLTLSHIISLKYFLETTTCFNYCFSIPEFFIQQLYPIWNNVIKTCFIAKTILLFLDYQ